MLYFFNCYICEVSTRQMHFYFITWDKEKKWKNKGKNESNKSFEIGNEPMSSIIIWLNHILSCLILIWKI